MGADGTLISELYRFSNFPAIEANERVGILEFAPDESFALVGIRTLNGSSTQSLLKISIPTGGIQVLPLPFVVGTDDMLEVAILDSSTAYLTLYDDQTTTRTFFYRFDLVTGGLTLMGSAIFQPAFFGLPQPGQMVVDDRGNLYFCNQARNLERRGELLRFDAALLQNPTPFTETDAHDLGDMYANDMTLDRSRNELYVGSNGAIVRVDANTGVRSNVIEDPEIYQHVDFLPGPTARAFGPYQPQDEGTLRFVRKEGVGLFCNYDRGDLIPRRPSLTLATQRFSSRSSCCPTSFNHRPWPRIETRYSSRPKPLRFVRKATTAP